MSHMKDKDGSRSSRGQARDDNWAKFEEYARQRESVGEGSFPIGSRNPLSPTSGRLHKEDMAIYGREPATDNMVLVVCEKCQRAVKSQAFMRHKEFCHPESLKGPLLQRVPVQTLGQPSAMFGAVANGSNLEGRKKAIDLDRHCGVWIENDKKHCKKSISCKIHSLEQRRKVVGRSRPLSVLITEYKKNKKFRKMERIKMGQISAPLMSPSQLPASSNHVPLSPTSPFTPQSPKLEASRSLRRDSPPPSSIKYYFDDVEVEECEDSTVEDGTSAGGKVSPSLEVDTSDDQLYPKPAAVCLFGRRVTTGRGFSSLFNHKLDALRSSLVFLAGREKDFSEVSTVPDAAIRRKYSSNLSHRTQQKRKYAHLGDQNHILLAESKFSIPQSLPQSLPSSTASSTLAGVSSTTIKTSSFYGSSNNNTSSSSSSGSGTRHVQAITALPVSSAEQVLTAEDQHQLQPPGSSHSKRFRRTPSGTDEQLLSDKHQGSLYSPFPNRQNLMNHVLEARSSQSLMDTEEPLKKQEHLTNHIDQWAEPVPENMPTDMQDFQIKMAPPTINGVMSSPNSLGGMVQPFSFNSQQTYLLNPSQQQPHPFPRGVVPIGLGVPHTPPSTSFPMTQTLPMPLLYPGDKPDPGLVQLMTQNRVPMQQPSVGHEGMDGGGGDINQFTRGQAISLSDNNLNSSGGMYNQVNQAKQFDNMQHQFNDNYFSDFSVNLTNQCVNPPGQFGNMVNQYGTQTISPSSLPRHSTSMTLHQMASAGVLVQSSNELVPNAPLPHPSNSSSQSSNPSPLHRIPPSGKQNSYIHSSQTGIVSPQSSAHRTQRVS